MKSENILFLNSSFNIPISISKIAYLASLISLFFLLFSTANAQQITTDSLAFSTDTITSDNALEEQVVSYAEDSTIYTPNDPKGAFHNVVVCPCVAPCELYVHIFLLCRLNLMCLCFAMLSAGG